MNGKRQKIVHVFSDKLCRFCAKSCGSKYYNIFENLLLYKQNQVSFKEIIKEVLDLNVRDGDGKSNIMCDCCKIKLIDFYDFKTQSKQEDDAIQATDETVIKVSNTPPPLLNTPKLRSLKENPDNSQIKHNDSRTVPTIDNEVKAVMVLFISILTEENLWTEHDRKFNKWNGKLIGTSQKCMLPRKYGDKCGVELNSFYKYLAHVITYHLLESTCPKCKNSYLGSKSLADHFQYKCLSKAKALKHEIYRQSLYN